MDRLHRNPPVEVSTQQGGDRSLLYRVDASIRKASGVQDVRFDGQDVMVTYDPSQVSPEEIQAAIEAGGDTVEPRGT